MNNYQLYAENADGETLEKEFEANDDQDANVQVQVLLNNWPQNDDTTAIQIRRYNRQKDIWDIIDISEGI